MRGPKGYGKRRQEIRARLQRGETAKAIARDLGVAPSTVYRAVDAKRMRKPGRAAYLSVATRVTDQECAALDRFVGRAGMKKRAAVLRRLVRFLGDFFAPTPDEEVFLASAEAHLSRLGGNFNQIAGSLSASMKKIGRADPTRQQVEMMLRAADDVAHIRTVLGQMLDNHQIKTETLRARLDAVDPLDDEYE